MPNWMVRKAYTHVGFKTVFLYKWMRHPMMLGLLIALWATPVMTLSHLLFSLVMSICVFIGIHFEERGLLRVLGPLKSSVVGLNARTMDFLTPSACPAARPPFPG